MNRSRILILSIISLILLLSCLITGPSLILYIGDRLGEAGWNQITVTVKSSSIKSPSESSAYFSIRDIERFQDILDRRMISACSRIKAYIGWKNRSLEADISGVSFSYSFLNHLEITEGSFFTEIAEREAARVAVIDNLLAFELFKTENVLGNKIDLFGKDFRIIGVVEKRKSLISSLTSTGRGQVYIPVSVQLEIVANTGIQYLQISFSDVSPIGQNREDVERALTRLGKNPYDYSIIDYKLKQKDLTQRIEFILFVLGLISIFFVFLFIYSEIVLLLKRIRKTLISQYFSGVLRTDWKYILIFFLKVILYSSVIFLVWRMIQFSPYIPPEYIPEELIDLSFYRDLFLKCFRERVWNHVYLPSFQEIELLTAASILNWLCVFSMIGTILLLLFCFPFLRRRSILRTVRVDTHEGNLLVLGIVLILSIAIILWIQYSAGLLFCFDWHTTAIIWLFIFINLIYRRVKRRSE